MTLMLHAAVASDLGRVRSNNEDAALAGRRLLAVADGIGGLPAGELASEAVMRALAVLEDAPAAEATLPALRAAVEAANREIGAAGRADPAREGMGTTVTALLLSGGTGCELALLHIGDSRAYLLRDGELHRLTRDDTLVQELVDQGLLSVEEARRHPMRSVVTRAVQGRPLELAGVELTACLGDRYLLCSDGLSDVVADPELAKALGGVDEPGRCAAELIELALAGGGPDNITAVVADLVEEVPAS
jgi:protein phosphatase